MTNPTSNATPPADYLNWRRQRFSERLAAPRAAADAWNHLITLVLFGSGPADAAALSASIASLSKQRYRNIEVLVIGPEDPCTRDDADFAGLRGLAAECSLTPQALLAERACDALWRGSHLVFARAGSEFDTDAFALLNAALNPERGSPHPDLVLCDHDRRLGPGKYAEPSFLPGWDPDLIQAFDYVGTAFMVSRALVLSQRAAGPPTSLHDWLCRLGHSQPGPVTAHVTETVLHLAGPPPALPVVLTAPRLPAEPLEVAIVIPNRNRPELLARCLGFLEYANHFRPEVLVLDNASDDPALPAFYAEMKARHGVRVLHVDQPFNFSRMVNLGVAATKAELVVLLNNDVQFSLPGKLEQLLAAAMRPEVGVVGCRLLYPDGTTQHAGMLLRPGPDATAPILATHVLRGAAREAIGYLHHLHTIRNWQAVTGALMVMRREVFHRVGGFDEVALPIEYNDIDFCLRVRRTGLRVITLPLDGVFHQESATRGHVSTSAVRMMRSEANLLMATRWADAFSLDPFCNPWVEMGEIPEVRFPWSAEPPTTPPSTSVESPPAPPPTRTVKVTKPGIGAVLCGLPERTRRSIRHRAKHALRRLLRARNLGERLHALLGRIISDAQMVPPPAPSPAPPPAPLPARPVPRTFPDIPRHLLDGLCVVGYFRSEIGLGQAARNIAYACDSQRLPVSFRHLVLPERENDMEFASKSNPVSDRKASLLITGLPSIIDLSQEIAPGRVNILYPFWELSRIPEAWMAVARGFDEIWAPSRFVAEAFPPSFGRPVRMMPLPVRLPVADPPVRQRRETLRLFTHLDFDSWGARKNPTGTVAAFQAAFPPEQRDVELIIKTRGHRDCGLREWLARATAADARIRVIDRTLDRAAVDALMADCDAFLSLHRSEGFGLGAAEALAAARAVVATDYGGTCDFITPETGYPVAYVLESVRPGEYVETEGQIWAEALQEAAVAALRAIYDDPAEADARARRGLALLRERHAPTIVGAEIARLLRQMGLL
jgi:GT2 family glycosyltransferase